MNWWISDYEFEFNLNKNESLILNLCADLSFGTDFVEIKGSTMVDIPIHFNTTFIFDKNMTNNALLIEN